MTTPQRRIFGRAPDRIVGASGDGREPAGSARRASGRRWRWRWRWRRVLGGVLVVGAGAVTALLAFHLVFMPLAVGHGKDVRVPTVVGLDVEDAEKRLTEAGLSARRSSERPSPEWKAGTVLDQEPRSGFSTRQGRIVSLVVSIGRGQTEVPLLAGESYRHAEIILTREGIPIGHVARQYADVPIDQVLRVSPPEGTPVLMGRPVDLLISAGPAPEAFVMPDFRGADPDQIARALRRLGYVVDVVYPVGAVSLRGRVISHTPPPGHRLETGDEVKIMAGEL